MEYNDKVIKRYGNSSQKRQLIAKQLRYKCFEESEWRKLAVKSWEALKKEAELGSRIYKPSDDMVIGVLGEECFDSYREYKDFQIKHPEHDFVHIAHAMIEINKGVINSMKKVASNTDKYLDGKKMIKIAADGSGDVSSIRCDICDDRIRYGEDYVINEVDPVGPAVLCMGCAEKKDIDWRDKNQKWKHKVVASGGKIFIEAEFTEEDSYAQAIDIIEDFIRLSKQKGGSMVGMSGEDGIFLEKNKEIIAKEFAEKFSKNETDHFKALSFIQSIVDRLKSDSNISIEAKRVEVVMNKIAEITDDINVFKKAVKFAISVKEMDKVDIDDIRNFLKDKKASQALYKIVKKADAVDKFVMKNIIPGGSEEGWVSNVSDPDEDVCRCKGRGWILSPKDVWHKCEYHYDGQKRP